MKKILRILSLCMTLSCLTLFVSCNDDGDAVGADPGDPEDFCSIELCQSNGTLKQVCIDEYNDCVATGARTKEECAAFAAETCTI